MRKLKRDRCVKGSQFLLGFTTLSVSVGRKLHEKLTVASRGKPNGRLHHAALFCLNLRLQYLAHICRFTAILKLFFSIHAEIWVSFNVCVLCQVHYGAKWQHGSIWSNRNTQPGTVKVTHERSHDQAWLLPALFLLVSLKYDYSFDKWLKLEKPGWSQATLHTAQLRSQRLLNHP